MREEKISVIVPVYNVEPYLSRCLDSICSQTYRDLEIILVDDGSPDASGKICDEYAQQDPRIRVIHTENHGAFSARNLALDRAEGAFIAFVDADDWLDADYFQVLLNLALQHGADIAQCELRNEGSYQQNRSICLGRDAVYQGENLTRAVFREEITHGLIGKLFRAECFAGRRFQEGYYHLDAVMLADIRNYCEKVARTDRAMYHYNTTNDSITRGRKKPMHVRSMEHLFEAYSAAAPYALPEGSFFICREIPSAGRLIPPGGAVTWNMARDHIRVMHRIFMQHWKEAQQAPDWQQAPRAKRLLWRIYARRPVLASVMVYCYGKVR